MIEQIKEEARRALSELLETAKLRKGDIVVVGCSSSEIVGQKIGTCSSMEAAEAVFDSLMEILRENSLFLAAQCCEHLNRSLVVEREAAVKYGLSEVNVVPHPHAGGAFGTTAYGKFHDPVMVACASVRGNGHRRNFNRYALERSCSSRPGQPQTDRRSAYYPGENPS